MIKVNKPQQAPAILRTKGKSKRATLCRNYNQHRAEYQSGKRTFTFDANIYGHSSVKQSLVEIQHSKCCFCESKVGDDGDVEHFRPKAACCQEKAEALIRPGYYWLAYDWDNLLLSCSACNQRHKRNYFPLADPTVRARSHRDNLKQEDPLFINPIERDPEQYISFRKEIPYSINNNSYGRATIAALGLDREILNERRRDHLSSLACLSKVVSLSALRPQDLELKRLADEAREFLLTALADDAEFAAMSRAASAENFYL